MRSGEGGCTGEDMWGSVHEEIFPWNDGNTGRGDDDALDAWYFER